MTARRYLNADGWHHPGLGDILRWAVVDRVLGRRPWRVTGEAAPVVPCAPAATCPGLTWLGHGSVLLSLAEDLWCLVDPVLSARIGPGLRRRTPWPLAATAWPKIDVVLITHNHRDHLDRGSIAALERQGAPHNLVPLGVERTLRAWGVAAERVTPLRWWEGWEGPKGVSVLCVPAQHWSQRGLWDRNRTWWCGFVVQGRGRQVYFAGDTAQGDHFAEIGERCPGLDWAVLPIGAYAPEWFMLKQHMNPEQALAAFRASGAEEMLAVHWGTFVLSDEALDEPRARLMAALAQAQGVAERVWAPPIGSTLALGR